VPAGIFAARGTDSRGHRPQTPKRRLNTAGSGAAERFRLPDVIQCVPRVRLRDIHAQHASAAPFLAVRMAAPGGSAADITEAGGHQRWGLAFVRAFTTARSAEWNCAPAGHRRTAGGPARGRAAEIGGEVLEGVGLQGPPRMPSENQLTCPSTQTAAFASTCCRAYSGR